MAANFSNRRLHPPSRREPLHPIAVASPRCIRCNNLERIEGFPDPTLSSLHSAGDIYQSAGECRGCRLLASGLELAAVDPTALVHVILQASLPLRIEGEGIDLEFFVAEGSQSPFPYYLGTAAHVPPGLDAARVAALAERWLRRCRAGHPACSARFSPSIPTTPATAISQPRPRRLVSVLGGLRLVEDPEPDAPYVALSYCWGDRGSNITTTRDTREERVAGICYADLPKTLQDAVAVTRALKIPYLWADSLCIIQDDVNGRDWRMESAKMDIIYEGAVLTLSATGAMSVTDGFLVETEDRAPELGSSVPIPWVDFNGRLVEVFVRPRLRHDVIIPEDLSVADTTRYPLLSRGWTFQERLLSTRTLHFLPQEIIWECRCDIWCECGGARADQLWKKGEFRGSVYNRIVAANAREGKNEDPSAIWHGLVQQYSKRKLSKRDDRLLALSGIARRFSSQFDVTIGSYLAGLWEVDFLWHLMWRVDYDQVGQLRDDATSASLERQDPGDDIRLANHLEARLKPTWSWISSRWPVTWSSVGIDNFRAGTECARLFEARCDADQLDKFGCVSRGKLIIDAKVVQFNVRRIAGENWVVKIGGGSSVEAASDPSLLYHDMEEYLLPVYQGDQDTRMATELSGGERREHLRTALRPLWTPREETIEEQVAWIEARAAELAMEDTVGSESLGDSNVPDEEPERASHGAAEPSRSDDVVILEPPSPGVELGRSFRWYPPESVHSSLSERAQRSQDIETLEGRFIPDDGLERIAIRPGDFIHCAVLFRYCKDNAGFYVGLGLRPLDPFYTAFTQQIFYRVGLVIIDFSPVTHQPLSEIQNGSQTRITIV
ncbi:hypothetical protein OQA88_2994 [Cercophora sp. LCS_1]